MNPAGATPNIFMPIRKIKITMSKWMEEHPKEAKRMRLDWYYRNQGYAKEKVKERKKKTNQEIREYVSTLRCVYCGGRPVRIYPKDSLIALDLISGISLATAKLRINSSRPICKTCVDSLRYSNNISIQKPTRTERIKELLGMSHGTANAILRKQIMFSMAQKLNMDICFVCGNIIESVNEFSIEHKISWENKDAGLFWDLNNIAFSHLRCNIQRMG